MNCRILAGLVNLYFKVSFFQVEQLQVAATQHAHLFSAISLSFFLVSCYLVKSWGWFPQLVVWWQRQAASGHMVIHVGAVEANSFPAGLHHETHQLRGCVVAAGLSIL